jgi:ATP-binding cassette, subfamily B, bacterial
MAAKEISRDWRKLVRYYPRTLRLVYKSSPRYVLVACLLTLIVSAQAPLQVALTKVIIDRFTMLVNAGATSSINWQPLIAPLLAVGIIWLVGSACESLLQGIKLLLPLELYREVNYLTLTKAAQMDLAFFELPECYDLMANAQRESVRVFNLAYFIFDLAAEGLALLAMLVLLARLHPLAVLVLIVTSVPQMISLGYYAGLRNNLYHSQSTMLRVLDYLNDLLSKREAVKEIRLFNLEVPFLEKYLNYSKKYFQENRALLFTEQRVSVLLSLLSVLGTIAIWVYTLLQALLLRITIGDIAMYFQAAERGRNLMKNFFVSTGLAYESSQFVSNVFKFLDLPSTSIDGALTPLKSGVTLPIPKPITRGIEFRNVSFRYPRAEKDTVRDISFVMCAGESVALVGENGAGKTTLVKLIARFYDPTEGVILLDGRDMREFDPIDLRRQFGVIFQDFVRYDFSMRENIGYGQIEYLNNQERILRAADDGGAREVITRLPRGLDTMLGRVFDEGTDLSGGEWQKVALSRAFMRDAQIIILDEPTASLDALAEQEVFDRFATLTTGKATLFISHRFSTVRRAQKILVLEEGRLIETGDHDQLMTLQGHYAKMFKTQAQHYL